MRGRFEKPGGGVFVLRLFLDICLLRRSPQDVPASLALLASSLVIYTGAGFILTLASGPPAQALISSLIDMIVMLILVYLLLALRNTLARLMQVIFGTWMFTFQPVRNSVARWLQTCTAISGSGAILTLLAVPLTYGLVYVVSGDSLRQLFYLMIIIAFLWNIAVIAHILRHALSSGITAGILAALVYVIVVFYVVNVFNQPSGG